MALFTAAFVAAILLVIHRVAPGLVSKLGAALGALAERRWVCITAIALLPVLARLAMVPYIPAKEPYAADDFSHLLAADTLLHGRLTNPIHPLSEHLQSVFILHKPTYSSVYTMGQAIILAAGILLFGNPWGGVLLAAALMGGALCWMLYGCLPARWAAGIGLLMTLQCCLFTYWVETFYGGFFAGFAGAIFLGALVRIAKNGPSLPLAVLAGFGWAIAWLIRPFESIILWVAVWSALAFFVRRDGWRRWVLTGLTIATLQISGGLFTLAHNHAVTGNYFQLPYQMAQVVTGEPQGLLWQPLVKFPEGRPEHFREPYQMQVTVAERNAARRVKDHGTTLVVYYLGFFYLPLAIAGLASFRRQGVLLALALVGVEYAVSILYPYMWPHYLAPYAGAMAFVLAMGAQKIWRWQPAGWALGPVVVLSLVAGSLTDRLIPPMSRLGREPKPPELRERTEQAFGKREGKHVMFVKYPTDFRYPAELVYNGADVDSQKIVWLFYLGPEKDARAAEYYKDRHLWVVDIQNGNTAFRPYVRNDAGQAKPQKSEP